MRQMTTEKLFDEGRYMVIYLYPEVHKAIENNKVVHKSMFAVGEA